MPDRNVGWPKETWDMKLEQIVSHIRNSRSYKNERDDLESIGFEFNLKAAKYGIIKVALLSYKNLNSHLLVPVKFVVPDRNVGWPEETWNMKLGVIVSSIRNCASYKNERDDLESIGFEFNLKAARYGILKVAC